MITKKLNITPAVIRALEEQQILSVESERFFRNPKIAESKRIKEKTRLQIDFLIEKKRNDPNRNSFQINSFFPKLKNRMLKFSFQ